MLFALILKGDWKAPEDWDVNLIFLMLLFTIAFAFLVAAICFFVQFLLKKKTRNRNGASSFDEKCLQEYIRGVGAYLGSDSDQELSLYRYVAADIYRHIPQKYWDLVDKIDDDISIDDRNAAWKDLKFFIKFIVRNEGK